MENRDNRKRMQFGSLEVRKLGPLIAFWRATDNTRHPSFPEPSGGGSITYNSSRARAQTRPSLSLWPLWELRAVIDRETVPSLHKCSTPEPVTPPPHASVRRSPSIHCVASCSLLSLVPQRWASEPAFRARRSGLPRAGPGTRLPARPPARHGAAGGLLLLGRLELHLPGVLPALLRLQPRSAGAVHGRDLPPAAGAAVLRGPLLPVAGWSLLALPPGRILPTCAFPLPVSPPRLKPWRELPSDCT